MLYCFANTKNVLSSIDGAVRACKGIAVAIALITLAGCQSTPTARSYPQNLQATAVAPQQNVRSVTPSQNTNLSDWSTRIQPLFDHARKLVQHQTGVDLSDVYLNVASDRTIATEVTHETQRLIHSQFDNNRFADSFLHSVMSGQKGTYAALYATRTNQVMVSKPLMQSYQRSLPNDPKIQQSAILALLIHELVHAADDKRYKIHENRDLNFRASFAQSAAFEGHAQWMTRNICSQSNCLSGLQALDDFMFGDRNPPNMLTQPVQAISRNVLEYSYVEGERFVSKLAQRPNGQKLIDHLLTNPPQDPIQILDPNSFPNTAREQRNQQLLFASKSFKHPWLSGAWASVETSPLKGVNLRTDPSRRDAAVDGFTRLITSMVAMQLYDQSKLGLAPIELTVIETKSGETAKLFGKTLHENTRTQGAQLLRADDLMKASRNTNSARLFVTKEPTENGDTYYTLIGVNGPHVVQVAGVGTNGALFVDYVDQLLSKLGRQYNASL